MNQSSETAIIPPPVVTVFVNGYWNSGESTAGEQIVARIIMPLIGEREWRKIKKEIALKSIGIYPGRRYWGADFVNAANAYFSASASFFVDGTGKWNSSGKSRYKAGALFAETEYTNIVSMLTGANGGLGSLCFLGHSMGCAYAAGMISFLEGKGISLTKAVMLSPADPHDFVLNTAATTLQLSICNDVALAYKNSLFKSSNIKGMQRSAIVKTNRSLTDDFLLSHIDTKVNPKVFEYLSDLEHLSFLVKGSCYIAGDLHFATQFKEITIGDISYTHTGENDNYKK